MPTYSPCKCGGLTTCYCGALMELRFAKTKSRVADNRRITLKSATIYFDIVSRYGLRPIFD